MNDLQGAPKVDLSVVDLSAILATTLKGIVCVQGITRRGKVGFPVPVGSFIEFNRKFGGLMADADFPAQVKRALDAGCPLIVSRVGHYIVDEEDETRTLAGTKATATLTVTTDSAVYTAKEVGAGYNGITIETKVAASGLAGHVDIEVVIPGLTEEPFRFIDMPEVPTASDKNKFNLDTKNPVDLGTVTGAIPIGKVTLATGAQVIADITTQDYIDGLKAFDGVTDAVRIHTPSIVDPLLDIATTAWVERRGDMRGILRTPVGVNVDGILDYRNGTGAYTHAPVNSWMMSMYTGGLTVTDELLGQPVDFTETMDALACKARKDQNVGEWWSTGGPQRGLIRNALGVVYNLGSAALQNEADRVSNAGVNAVINDATYGIAVWDNVTLQKAATLLKHENIAELVIYMRRAMKPLFQSELFNPNDPITWRQIYKKINSLVLRPLKDGRAISDYAYQGDQDVDDINECVLNDVDDIGNGKYRVRIFFKPIAALKWIGVELVVTNNSVQFSELFEVQNLA